MHVNSLVFPLKFSVLFLFIRFHVYFYDLGLNLFVCFLKIEIFQLFLTYFVFYLNLHRYFSHSLNFSCSCLTAFRSDFMDVMFNELSVCLFVGMYLLFL